MARKRDMDQLKERYGTFDAPIGTVALPETGVRYDKRGNPKPLQSGQDEHEEPAPRGERRKRQPEPELQFSTDLFDGDPREKAVLATCHKVLAGSVKTEKQLRDKLIKAEHEPDMVEFGIQRAVANGLIDDAAYADSWVESRIRRGHGRLRIQQDLSQRGISRELIAAALEEHASGDELDVAAVEAARKKAARLDLEDPKQRAKVERYLAGRGYSAPQVFAAVRAIRAERS